MYESTESYLEILLTEAKSGLEDVQLKALQGISIILDFRPELIFKHYEAVFRLMIDAL
jgi:hypothetical protein